MSIAKKSTKWLVALFVIFALLLTATFAAGGVTIAKADPVEDSNVPTDVIVEVTATNINNSYPTFVNANGTVTLTVNYYLEIPAAAEEDDLSIMKFAPVLTYPGSKTVKPDSIALNTAFENIATLEGVTTENNEGYLDEGGADAFTVDLLGDATLGDLNGVTNGAIASNGNYLFTATYVLDYDAQDEDDVVCGDYELALLGEKADSDEYYTEFAGESEGDIYIPVVTNGEFAIYDFVDYPTITTTSFVYGGADVTRVLYNGTNAGYTYTNASAITVGEYTATFTLNDYYIWRAGNAQDGYTYTTDDHEVDWEITKMQIAIPEEDNTEFVFTGSAQNYTVAASDYYTVTGTPQTNAGEYEVTISLDDTDNTEWSDGTTEDLVYDFIIAKMQIAIPEEGNEYYVYTGSAQTYAFAADINSTYIAITDGTKTNAGTYSPIASLKDTSNTEWSDGTSAAKTYTDAFVISKAAVALPEDFEVEYDGSAHGVTTSALYNIQDGNGSTLSATNVGEYASILSLTDPDNYAWSVGGSEAKTVEWEITPKAISEPVLDTSSFDAQSGNGFVFDGTAKEIYWTSASLPDGNIASYSGTKTATNVGNYTAKYVLSDKANYVWATSGTTDDVEYAWFIETRVIEKPSITQANYTYNGSVQTYESTTTWYSFTGSGTNYGTYPVTVSLTDTDNTKWNDNTTASYEVADKISIAKKVVTLTVAVTSNSQVYGATPATVTVTPTGLVNSNDLGTITYTAKTWGGSSYIYYTAAQFQEGLTVGNYIIESSYTPNDNYYVDDQSSQPYEVTKATVTPPEAGTNEFIYTGSAVTYVITETALYTVSGNTQTEIGEYNATVALTDKTNYMWSTTENSNDLSYPYSIIPGTITVTFTYSYGNDVKTVAEDVEIVNVVTTPMRALPTVSFFKSAGWEYQGNIVTHYTMEMDGATLNAVFTYAVGAGDADGDGIISSADVVVMKRWSVGLDKAKKIANAAEAWTAAHDENFESGVLYTALDANGNGSIRSNDIVAVREALVTGHNYKVIVSEGIVMVAKVNRVNVNNYADLVSNIRIGNPVTLTADIEAANEIFDEDSVIPVDIDLGTNRLTVKGFTLNTDTAGATLKIANGTLYTVTGISVTAPSGNVIVAGVNGYSYDGTSVNLAAYSSSLHIEDDVAFYIYKAQDPVTGEDYANVHAFVADVYTPTAEVADIVTALSDLADTRIGETEARMADIAEIKADTTKTEAQKAEDINALDVKKAIIEVPIDTHVVVEESAALDVDKIVVKQQSDATAPAVTTFSIEVKNTNVEAATVVVDISEVKDDTGAEVVYYVENVNISGTTSKVEVVSAENQQVEVKKYVAMIGTTSYESLQAAIDAAQNADTIKLIANITDGTGIKTADDNKQKTKVGKTFTIDFNGYTYTVNGAGVGSSGTETQAMHWGEKDNITLKNGSLVISVNGATIPNPANNKIIKMAMQNYANLTVKNMTMDFSNIVVRNYGTYTGKDAPYSGLEIPLFNLNAGSMTIENTTITMPNDSTKGVLIEIPDAATIKNSTINGYVSLGQLTSNVTIVDSTVTGVVSYFAGYGVKHSGNVYRLGGVSVTNATELQAALNAGAIIIDIENDFNAPNPIAVTKSTIINGYDHTITSAGNRIMNVTEPDLVITINDLTMTSATSERGLNIWDSATGSDITLNNVYIDAHLYAINYVNGADDATLVVNDSYLKGWGAINAHFNDSSVVVNNSTLYGINRTNDHTYGFNTITIDGDSLHGAQEGEHGVNNTFVFDGCTIIAEVRDTHQDWISFQYAASGNTATVVVNNCEILDAPNGNDKTYAMSIQGTNNAVVLALSAEQYAIVASKHFNITDNGDGTYTVMPKTANINYFGTAYNFYDVFENGWLEDTEAFTLTDDVVLDTDVVFARNRAAAIAVSGGTFEMNLDGNEITGNGKILLPVGVTCVTDSDVSIADIFEAPEGEVIIESTDADGNYIYAVGVAYVKTKAEFTSAITAGAKEIVICADINLSMYTYNRDMDITIDLNGHTLTTTMTGITFSAARTLNIKDSSANGTGAINSTGNYAINMGTASTADTEINIYGGTLTGKTSAAVKVNDGTLNVYGGTLTCPAADKYAILNYQGYAGTVNIYDGTFTAAVAVANNGTGEVNIYGGTFSADPSDFVAPGYMAVEDEGTWTIVEAEITITTFAELKAAIADVNAGNIVYPTLIIANDIAFEEELTISKSVYIMGDGEVKFIGYDASTKYDEAFYINVADEDQEITIDGIVFDHFCYYSNVANKTKATASAVKNGVAYITYGGNCPASTTLYITGCQFLGTARDMINASSTIGCKGFIAIEDCYFDATDRLSSTLNMLSFYGNDEAELYVIITGCTFKEASEQNATWATSAIASFGNADLTISGCEFIACQIGIAIDNTFDRLFDTSTYPVYYNTTVNAIENTYTNCYFGYYEESVLTSVDEVPEGAELYTDEPFTYGDAEATQFHFAAEYDLVVGGTQGVDAKYLVVACYYIAA